MNQPSRPRPPHRTEAESFQALLDELTAAVAACHAARADGDPVHLAAAEVRMETATAAIPGAAEALKRAYAQSEALNRLAGGDEDLAELRRRIEDALGDE